MEQQSHHTPQDRQPDSDRHLFEAQDDPIVAQGLSEHGDAFRAFLRLPATDPQVPDLLDRFEDSYIGTYASISELADELTEVPACKAQLDRVAARWGLDGLFTVDEKKLRALADSTWNIVEIGGKIHVFSR